MEKNNNFASFTDEKLLKTQKLLKGILIGFGIIFLISIGVITYLIMNKGFDKISIPTLLPLFILPITLSPALINLSLINKEIKTRSI